MVDRTFVVDRIEGEYLIIETSRGEIINISLDKVIGDIKEGSILIEKDNKYILDIEKTKEREEVIDNLMKGMWK